jgi:hypothetical protein
VVGGVEDDLVQPVRRRLLADEGAELPALGVRHHRPPRPLVDDRGPEVEQLLHRAGVDVEVHAVLHGLRLGHPVDPDGVLRCRPAQDRVPVTGVDELQPEHGRPERREAERVDGVETEILVRGRCHRRRVENLRRVCRSTVVPLV